MALTPEQEQQLLAHLSSTNNPHITTSSQIGIVNTDNVPEGRINLYGITSTSLVVPIKDWFPDAVSYGYEITKNTGWGVNLSQGYVWIGGQQYNNTGITDIFQITPPSGSDRTDLVYLDQNNASTDYTLLPSIQEGDVTLPSGCFALCEIFVPSTATDITQCTITDKRVLVGDVNVEAAVDAANEAETYKDQAATSASNAATSETNAANSASAAATSESNAATSETNASNSASAAATSESNAANSASAASTSETNASNSASAAATSETNAANSASAAATSASNAATSESNAANSATAASTSETNAANSETNASNSASAAATSETNASNSATASANSASAASTSETNASNSASNAATSESNAETYKNQAATSESNAETYKNQAATSESNAANSASAAANSATNASNSESNAATSATTAVNAKDTAVTYRDEAYDWAEEAEDTQVTDSAGHTGYSAYHWAKKAEQSAGQGDMQSTTYDPNNIEADVFNRANHTGTQTASTISDFDTEVSNNTDVAANTTFRNSKGTANGVAELDANGTVPSAQLPSFVDDVLEYNDFASLPATGETGKIYITLDDNKTYRWGGSVYVTIGTSLALGETSDTAYRGDRGKIAYDHSQTAHAPADATHNSPDSTLLDRANHTGTQTASTISDFDTEVSNNTDVSANTTHRNSAHAPSDATHNSPDSTLLDRSNHTGTQTASTISDFDTEVSNNTDVSANTTHRNSLHAPSDATHNSPDSTLLDRANHTGTQTASTISDFDTEVSNNTDVSANTTHRNSLHAPSDATHNSPDSTLLDRTNHTGTQTASTISDFDTEVSNNTDVSANTTFINNINTSIGNIMNPLLHLPLKNGFNIPFGVGDVTFTRASSATYIDLQGIVQKVGNDEPRFCKDGLLMEGESTNSLPYSEELDHAGWSKYNLTISANATTAPDGTTTADGLIADSNGYWHSVEKDYLSITGNIFSFSFFVKKGDKDWVGIELYAYDSEDDDIFSSAFYFNLADGLVGSLPSEGTSIDITQLEDGWFWCNGSLEYTGSSTIASMDYVLFPAHADGNSAVTGDGSTINIYIWGTQLEQSNRPTSYIPTTSGAVTRAMERCFIPAKDNLPGTKEPVTVLFDYKLTRLIGSFGFAFEHNDTYLRVYLDNDTITGNITSRLLAVNGLDTHNVHRIGLQKDESKTQSKLFINGVLKVTDVLGSSTMDPSGNIYIGCGSWETNSYYGCISNLRIYDRALTTEEMRIA